MRPLPTQKGDILDLLLASPLPRPGPWFVEQTLARCRREAQKPSYASRLWPLVGLALLASVFIVADAFVFTPNESVAVKIVPEPTVSQAFVVVATSEGDTGAESEDQSPM